MIVGEDIERVATLIRNAAVSIPLDDLPKLIGVLAEAQATANTRAIKEAACMKMDTTWKQLVDARAMATLLNVPVSWVREEARRGRIPSHRLGRYVRFDPAKVIDSTAKPDTY